MDFMRILLGTGMNQLCPAGGMKLKGSRSGLKTCMRLPSLEREPQNWSRSAQRSWQVMCHCCRGRRRSFSLPKALKVLGLAWWLAFHHL